MTNKKIKWETNSEEHLVSYYYMAVSQKDWKQSNSRT